MAAFLASIQWVLPGVEGEDFSATLGFSFVSYIFKRNPKTDCTLFFATHVPQKLSTGGESFSKGGLFFLFFTFYQLSGSDLIVRKLKQ